MGNPGLTRRQLLRGTAGLGLGALVASCGGGGHSGGGTPTATPSTSRSPVAPNWDSLRTQLKGALYRPNESGYNSARLLFNRQFDAVSNPDAIAAVANEQDVVACVRFATQSAVPLRIRAGGHSYLGASTGSGLVVDLRGMHGVAVDGGLATIGTGAQLIDVYGSLAPQGVLIPAGSCPSVGVAGLTLGGGMGVVGRKFGLTCDRLESARVVLADGRAVTASAHSEPDLYWALRGGGGNFGIVTSLTLRTYPAQVLSLFSWNWPWDDAANVLAGWQKWMPSTPDELWSTCHLLATAGSRPTASVSGVYVGDVPAMQNLLGGLRDAVGRPPNSTFAKRESPLTAMLIEAGCGSSTQQACHVGDFGAGSLKRDAFVAASDYFSSPIPSASIDAAVSAVEVRQIDPALGVGGIAFDSWGGAVNMPSPGDTAFVHRRSMFAAQYTASWQDQPGNTARAANQASLSAIQATLHPVANGEAYQNYADATLADPLTAYYGSNLLRLGAIKKKYDPDSVFNQPQGISPA